MSGRCHTRPVTPKGRAGRARERRRGRELPLQDVCTGLRDAGTPNGALRSPRIAEGKERRGQESGEKGRGHFPARHRCLCPSPAEGNRSKRKRRDLARDVRQEQIPRQSDLEAEGRARGCAGRGMCRSGECAPGALCREQGWGDAEGGRSRTEQLKVILVDLKQSDAFLTPKFIALGLDGEGKGNI